MLSLYSENMCRQLKNYRIWNGLFFFISVLGCFILIKGYSYTSIPSKFYADYCMVSIGLTASIFGVLLFKNYESFFHHINVSKCPKGCSKVYKDNFSLPGILFSLVGFILICSSIGIFAKKTLF